MAVDDWCEVIRKDAPRETGERDFVRLLQMIRALRLPVDFESIPSTAMTGSGAAARRIAVRPRFTVADVDRILRRQRRSLAQLVASRPEEALREPGRACPGASRPEGAKRAPGHGARTAREEASRHG